MMGILVIQLWLHVYQMAQSDLKIGFGLVKKKKRWKRGRRTGLGTSTIHMVAVLAGCRKAMVGTGWAVSFV